MAVKIIEEKPIPRQQVICQGCSSILEYSNGDLISKQTYSNGLVASYKIKCPVCGVYIECGWIKSK